MAKNNINISISGQPIDILKDINSEITNIVAGYNEQKKIVEEINNLGEEYLETLINIEYSVEDITKKERERKKILTDISRINGQIRDIVSTQSTNASSLNQKYEKQIEDLEKIRKKHEDNNRLLQKEIEKNRYNLKLLNDNLNSNRTINDSLDKRAEKQDKLNKKSEEGNKAIATMFSLGEKLFSGIKGNLKQFDKVEGVFNRMNVHLGLNNNQLATFKQNMYAASKQSLRYGLDWEEASKMQQQYWNDIGRTINISTNDFDKFSATYKVFGSTGIQTAANLDKYGFSLTSSLNIIERASNTAKKNGVDMVAHNKAFNDNLKLTNRYNFRDGVDGISRMTANAIKLRMNMGEVAKLAEKVNTPEGAIETAARLQVLGGNFASNADPLAMLYESNMDFEALGERYKKMFGDVMSLNSKTGMVDFRSWGDRQRAKVAAEAAGVDFDATVDMVRTTKMRSIFENKFRNNSTFSGYDENLKNILASQAKREADGNWYVTGADGNKKNVLELNDADKKFLIPNEHKLSDIALSTMSIGDNVKAIHDMLKSNIFKSLSDSSIYKKLYDAISGGKEQMTQMDSALLSGGLLGLAGLGRLGAKGLYGYVKNRAIKGARGRARGRNGGYGGYGAGFNGQAGNRTLRTRGTPSPTPTSRGRLGRVGKYGGILAASAVLGYGAYNMFSGGSETQSVSPNTTDISSGNDLLDNVITIREILENSYKNNNFNTNGRGGVTLNNESDISSGIKGVGNALVANFADEALMKVGTKLGGRVISPLSGARGVGLGLGLEFGGAGLEMYSNTLNNPLAKHGLGLSGAMMQGAASGVYGGGLGLATGAASGAVRYGRDRLLESGSIQQNGIADYALTMGQGALSGAALGAMFGPKGAAIGAILGGASTGLEKWIGSDRITATGKYNQHNTNLNTIGEMDDLSALRTIAKSTYSIEQILIKKYGEVVDKSDLEEGIVEKGLSWFNKNILGVSVNDAVIKDGKITPINTKDDLMIGKPNGPLFDIIKPKPINGAFQNFLPSTTYNGSSSNGTVKDINLNFNGKISLDAGKFGNLDISSLMQDPNFQKEITKLVTQQLSKDEYGGRTKGEFNRKTLSS